MLCKYNKYSHFLAIFRSIIQFTKYIMFLNILINNDCGDVFIICVSVSLFRSLFIICFVLCPLYFNYMHCSNFMFCFFNFSTKIFIMLSIIPVSVCMVSSINFKIISDLFKKTVLKLIDAFTFFRDQNTNE